VGKDDIVTVYTSSIDTSSLQ